MRLIHRVRRLISGKKAPEFVHQSGQTYLKAYADYIDKRVDWDPKLAVGGMWGEIGRLQFEFLKKQGLEPKHELLDVGCGTLRGGMHFISYLKEGNYSGYDISARAIDYAHDVIKHKFVDQRPLVFHNMEGLQHHALSERQFDFILAQSVFTHLGPELIEIHFQYLDQVLKPGGVFYFTFDEANESNVEREVDFQYPISFFKELSKAHGFRLNDHRSEYVHPRNQVMLSVRK